MQDIASISPLSSKLDAITDSLGLFLPEFTITATFILILISGLLLKKEGRRGLPHIILPVISTGGLAVAGYFLLAQWQLVAEGPSIFLGMARADRLSVYVRVLFIIATAGTIIINRSYYKHKEHAARSPEFYLLIMGLLLGAMIMSMATNLLLLFLSIEMVSLSAYVLTGFLRSAKSAEAGVKYLIFGATASGLMLFGMSLLYGFSGTLAFTDSTFIQNLGEVPALPLAIGSLLVLAGLFFKISLVPLHIWAPDVYEGGPLPAVALFSIVPKVAGLVVLLRLFYVLTNTGVYLPGVSWQEILAVTGIATLIIGNLAALWQNSARRLMAYSSIAHGGFMLAGILTFTDTGVESLLFYVTVYGLMNLAAFQWLAYFEHRYGIHTVKEFAGLSRQEPLAAICLLVTMVALTGLPPTAGFTAKLLVFGALWDSYGSTGYTAVLVFLLAGLFTTIAALFYYLKIPYYLFFRKPEEVTTAIPSEMDKLGRRGLWAGTILTIPLLIFFVKADWLSDMIRMVNFVLQIPG